MSSVYLDNNIIIDIEQGKTSIEEISNNIKKEISEVYYSSAHIHELNEITGNSFEEKNIRISNRFSTITNITNNNYLFINHPDNNVYNIIEPPLKAYETINDVSFARDIMKSMINFIGEEQREVFRNHIGINMMELNNYNAEEALEHINKKLSILNGLSFLELIEKSIDFHPDGKTFGIHNRFAGIFELLDMIGYWKDKYNSKSNYARLWDSSHAYFASYCDIFISNDKRTVNKTKVAYKIYDIKTEILNPYLNV